MRKSIIEYKRKILSVITSIYSSQKKLSVERKHLPPDYSKKQLVKWMLGNNDFIRLYIKWVDSGFDKYKKPSLDRKNNEVGYSFKNIQVVTFRENLVNAARLRTFRKVRIIKNKKLLCIYCNKAKYLNYFYRQSSALCGYSNKCILCTKKYNIKLGIQKTTKYIEPNPQAKSC